MFALLCVPLALALTQPALPQPALPQPALSQPALSQPGQTEPQAGVDLHLEQVHPGSGTAFVLIHGYWPAPTYSAARTARLHDWQQPDARLVESLGAHGAVYGLGYGQDAAVEAIVPDLRGALSGLRDQYDEIVLIGHSAGGVLARELVVRHPEAGVERVVQVCAPNGGVRLAALSRINLRPQEPFVASLSHPARWPAEGGVAEIPEDVELISVICHGAGVGDGLVSVDAQWPPDLQAAGVAAYRLPAMHFTAMRLPAGVELITELAAGGRSVLGSP